MPNYSLKSMQWSRNLSLSFLNHLWRLLPNPVKVNPGEVQVGPAQRLFHRHRHRTLLRRHQKRSGSCYFSGSDWRGPRTKMRKIDLRKDIRVLKGLGKAVWDGCSICILGRTGVMVINVPCACMARLLMYSGALYGERTLDILIV
jgi:hypothetical protein